MRLAEPELQSLPLTSKGDGEWRGGHHQAAKHKRWTPFSSSTTLSVNMSTPIPTNDEGLVPVNGAKVRRYRTSRGMSQQTLAAAAGMSRSYLADIERGEKQPRPVYAAAIAGALRVDIEDLLTASRT